MEQSEVLPIRVSCYFSRSRAGEQFIPEHMISYVISGSIELSDGEQKLTFGAGDLYFCRRNQFAKYTKTPPENGEFRSVSVSFEQDMLRKFSVANGYSAETAMPLTAFTRMEHAPVLKSYMDSLQAYAILLDQDQHKDLLLVKQQEALLLLLKARPELKYVLFDFTEPGKIDLEAFMNKNYHFNVELKRFAYLSGRSLSTFKRDFEKIFHLAPRKWLLQKRLQEAYYLIQEEGRSASEVYIDLGFEDLSHFSFSFKKQFGIAPSLLKTGT